MASLTDVTSGHFNLLSAIYVGQKSKAKAIRARRIRETVNTERRLRRMKRLANAGVLLIVGYAAPIRGFGVINRLNISTY